MKKLHWVESNGEYFLIKKENLTFDETFDEIFSSYRWYFKISKDEKKWKVFINQSEYLMSHFPLTVPMENPIQLMIFDIKLDTEIDVVFASVESQITYSLKLLFEEFGL